MGEGESPCHQQAAVALTNQGRAETIPTKEAWEEFASSLESPGSHGSPKSPEPSGSSDADSVRGRGVKGVPGPGGELLLVEWRTRATVAPASQQPGGRRGGRGGCGGWRGGRGGSGGGVADTAAEEAIARTALYAMAAAGGQQPSRACPAAAGAAPSGAGPGGAERGAAAAGGAALAAAGACAMAMAAAVSRTAVSKTRRRGQPARLRWLAISGHRGKRTGRGSCAGRD